MLKKILAIVLLMLMVFSIVGCAVIEQDLAEYAAESDTILTEETGTPDLAVQEDGEYSDAEHVALYIHTFGKLPGNYITKKDAEKLGWNSREGNLHKVLPGRSIGGDHYGNYEEKLPKAKGRKYHECDIDYTHGGRNGKRIVFSNDGLIFYTDDHYNSFTQLY